MQKSKHHLAFGKWPNAKHVTEFVKIGDRIYKTTVDYPFDIYGNRMGLRFECPAWQWNTIKRLLVQDGMEFIEDAS